AAKKAVPSRPGKRAATARAPAKEAGATTELEREWAATKALFLTLENNHGCEAMGMQCSLFGTLLEGFNQGGSRTPTLRQVKSLHDQLRTVQRRQE
ncbi:hypothetical protein, partial [Corallococcus sp. 4LFB]|uniref:hypothetical protein n=1 Tax=Corallococcus sp. 4LFB TaxID=3383249 RepID=UPI00397692B8